MTVLVCIMLTCLAIMSFVYAKSYLYPPVVFSAVWAVLLFGLAISGSVFYPLSYLALAIFFIGAAAFCCGGMTTLMIVAHQEPNITNSSRKFGRAFVERVLNFALLAQVVIAPLYWRKLKYISSLSDIDNLLVGLRVQSSFQEVGERVGLGIFAYIVAMMTILTLIAVYESDSSPFKRARASLYIMVTLAFQLLTAARGGAALLVISLFIIVVIKTGKVRLRNIAFGILAFLIVFSIPAVILNKGGSLEASVAENISSLSVSFRDYTLPSLVAFDRTLAVGESTGSLRSFRSIFSIANAFGAKINLPPDILEYTLTPIPTNLYTLYYYYYLDFGFTGCIILMFVLGMLCTFVYQYAISGEPSGVILYSLIASSLIMSGLSEAFLCSASFWIQAILIVTIIYSRRLNSMLIFTDVDKLLNRIRKKTAI